MVLSYTMVAAHSKLNKFCTDGTNGIQLQLKSCIHSITKNHQLFSDRPQYK